MSRSYFFWDGIELSIMLMSRGAEVCQEIPYTVGGGSHDGMSIGRYTTEEISGAATARSIAAAENKEGG
jgi:hypothetical protein